MKIKAFPVNPFGENTYIVWNEETRDAVIVDPGMFNDGERKVVDNFIAANNLNPKYLFLTHMHVDHAMSANYISHKYSLPVMSAEEEQTLASRLTEQAAMFGLGGFYEPVTIDKFVHDGDEFPFGTETIKAIQVPGHSPGGLTFYFKESGFLLCGDVLFYESIGRTDLPGGSYEKLVSGIKNKVLALPDDTVIYTGHGEPTTVGHERNYNGFLGGF